MSKSKLEILLEALANGESVDIVPQSRNEVYLLSLLKGETDVPEPKSRVEAYLHRLCKDGITGGGTSGGGGITPTGTIEITENGTHDVTSYASANVNVEIEPTLQEKTTTENGVVVADSGYDGLSKVTVNVASSGGGDIDALIDGSITEVSSNVESIGQYAFHYASNLKTINFPSAKTLYTRAFANCTALEEVNFPSVISMYDRTFSGCTALKKVTFSILESVESYSFNECTSLETIDFPLLKQISQSAFYNTALTDVNLPLVTTMGTSVFGKCSKLVSVNLPLVSRLENSVFESCTSLMTLNIPSLTYIGNYTFRNCKALKVVNFPLVESMMSQAFQGCTSLTAVDLTSIKNIGTSIFSGCTVLTTLILRNTTMVTLGNVNSFGSTPIASGTGYIYVPRDLVESYKTATNWTTYASQFRALEDYTVDGTITGELDETKI